METLTKTVQDLEADKKPIEASIYLLMKEPDLYKIVEDKEPLLINEYEGKIFMRGSCGNKPCKGYYQ